MPITLTVEKVGSSLVPAEDVDREALKHVKQRQGFKVNLVRRKNRSIKNHKLYWGGLIPLVADYWEPENGLKSKYDKKVLNGLIKWVSEQGHSVDGLSKMIELYLDDRAAKIKKHVVCDDLSDRHKKIHLWLKDEAGYYDVYLTETGIQKEYKSTNFDSMEQAEFLAFFNDVKIAAHREVLKKNGFHTIDDVDRHLKKMAEQSKQNH